jgi:hypothetical protein
MNDGVPGLKPRHRVLIGELTGSFSPRLDGENASILAQLAEPLPPIVVHRATMRIVDGLHRVRAAGLRGEEFIDAVFCDGSEDDAFVLAVDLNRAHGLPLSTADREAAATRIVRSHPDWSDQRVATVTGLAAPTVTSIRARSTDQFGQSDACADVPAARPDDTSPAELIATLVRDPSLRFTEAGRALLWFLDGVSVDQRQWEDIAQSIPADQRAIVVSLARECATMWQQLAEQLEHRADDGSPQSPGST